MRGVARRTDRDQLVAEASGLLREGRRLALVACHDESSRLRIAYVFTGGRGTAPVELVLEVPADDAWLPTLTGACMSASQFEREIFDLFGIRPAGHPQPHRLVRHAHWPPGWHPMLSGSGPAPEFAPDTDSYPFAEVAGDGIYEIAVGPVHAGIIEPGHFRFSVVGETIVRMETRLWFLHRGIERIFEGAAPEDGIRLAERITGDTSIGHSLAYAMAVEAAAGIQVPERARLIRALLLELERLYNHVTDLGAIAGDTGFGIANVHAGRLRERLMRLNRAVTGHRLLRGSLSIGGASLRALPEPGLIAETAVEVADLVQLTLNQPIVRDRLAGTAVLPADRAAALGTVGYVARAAGIDLDVRRDAPFADLGDRFDIVTEAAGDVLARYLVRAREFAISTAVASDLITRIPTADPAHTTSALAEDSGFASVEAWRGTLSYRVELGPDGRISRAKVVDPSFFNWPALPVAMADTIVPDFPLSNKSFNQSYAGNDL